MIKTIFKGLGVLVAVVVVLAVIGGVGVAVFKGRAKSDKTGDLNVWVETVKTGTLTEVVSAPGVVEPLTKVDISARVSARITALPFEEGQRVKTNDILVQLDDADLTAALRSAESRREGLLAQIKVEEAQIASRHESLKGTQTLLVDAQRQMSRQQALIDTGDASQQAFDQAKRTFDELTARIASETKTLEAAQLGLAVTRFNIEGAEAEIQRVRDNLAYTTIRSPIDGVVTRLNVEVGEIAITGTMNNPGTVLLTVADLSKMTIVAQVDEADIRDVKPGQSAGTRIAAYPGEIFAGTIQSVALSIANPGPAGGNLASRYFETTVVLDEVPEGIRSGLSADVEIQVQTHDGYALAPSPSVLSLAVSELPDDIRQDNPLVDDTRTLAIVIYTLKDDKAVVTPVRIGPSDDQNTIIAEGLSPNDTIITGPYAALEKLKHDKAVQVKRRDGEKTDKDNPQEDSQEDSQEGANS